MTWNELKERIDKKIAERGGNGDIEIEYIDVSATTLSYPDPVTIVVDDHYLTVS